MKLKYEFAIREIADEYVLIPMGGAALEFSGMVSTNAVGAFICEKLQSETTAQALLEAICGEFAIDKPTARADMDAFLESLRKANMLEE